MKTSIAVSQAAGMLILFTWLGVANAASCAISDYGLLNIDPPHHSVSKRTDHITAGLGTVFGVTHRFEGIPEGRKLTFNIAIRNTQDKNAQPLLISSLDIPPDYEYSYFKFETMEELKEGGYHFSFVADGIELCRKVFHVGISTASDEKLPIPFSGQSFATADDSQLRAQVIEKLALEAEASQPSCKTIEQIKAESPMYLGLIMGMPFNAQQVPREEFEVWEVKHCEYSLQRLVTFSISASGTSFIIGPIPYD